MIIAVQTRSVVGQMTQRVELSVAAGAPRLDLSWGRLLTG
jgi:hypothetical protein